jgi:hypothetical protein
MRDLSPVRKESTSESSSQLHAKKKHPTFSWNCLSSEVLEWTSGIPEIPRGW